MSGTDFSWSTTVCQSQPDACTIDLKSSHSGLSGMINRIADIVSRAHPPQQATIGHLLSEYAQDADLLAKLDLPPSADRYARHILHRSMDFSVLAIVWLPGQMSPVHSHKAWCALAVHRGALTESLFQRGPRGIECVAAQQLSAGAFSHAPPEAPVAHRMANTGVVTAVSLHVYGTSCDRLGHEVNNIWAD